MKRIARITGSFLSVGGNDDAVIDEILVPRDIPEDVPIGTLRSTDAVSTGGGEDNASILIESAGVPPTPSQFIADGGKAAVTISPAIETTGSSIAMVGVTRGESTTVSMNFQYLAGDDAARTLTIRGVGVVGGYIPPAIAARNTSEERANEFGETDKLTGMYELDSTQSFSPSEVTLEPGKTTTARIIIITIPKDWSSETVGKEIIYNIQYEIVGDYDKSTERLFPEPLQVHIQG